MSNQMRFPSTSPPRSSAPTQAPELFRVQVDPEGSLAVSYTDLQQVLRFKVTVLGRSFKELAHHVGVSEAAGPAEVTPETMVLVRRVPNTLRLLRAVDPFEAHKDALVFTVALCVGTARAAGFAARRRIDQRAAVAAHLSGPEHPLRCCSWPTHGVESTAKKKAKQPDGCGSSESQYLKYLNQYPFHPPFLS